MSLGHWRYAAASVIDMLHLKFGSACQDANDCHEFQLPSGERIFVGVVADGAGSAKSGGEGAALSCKVFTDLVSDYVSSGNTVEQIAPETTTFWLDVIRTRLLREAESTSKELRDYACTFLGAVVGSCDVLPLFRLVMASSLSQTLRKHSTAIYFGPTVVNTKTPPILSLRSKYTSMFNLIPSTGELWN